MVKRIGDELMVTFSDVQGSEHFIASLIADEVLQPYRYKIGVDYGIAYHFRFMEHLADDPYGPVVDRCARIAKYARAGTVICSGEYRNTLGNSSQYVSMGSFALRGFRVPEELFARALVEVDSEEYLRPLVDAANEEGQRVRGYRFVGRKLTTDFVREFAGAGDVRPFLARELLNVPKLPYSPLALQEATGGTGNLTEREREFFGYPVEWEGTFESFTRDDRQITVWLVIGGRGALYTRLSLLLPPGYFDLIKGLKVGQRLLARGVIHHILVGVITLNYVDLETLEDS